MSLLYFGIISKNEVICFMPFVFWKNLYKAVNNSSLVIIKLLKVLEGNWAVSVFSSCVHFVWDTKFTGITPSVTHPHPLSPIGRICSAILILIPKVGNLRCATLLSPAFKLETYQLKKGKTLLFLCGVPVFYSAKFCYLYKLPYSWLHLLLRVQGENSDLWLEVLPILVFGIISFH